MPEGPEVAIVADVLNIDYSNLVLIRLFKYENFKKFKSILASKDDQNFNVRRTLKSVYSKGKKIVFDFEDIYIFSFLAMDGHWVEKKGKYTCLELTFGIKKGGLYIEKKKLYYDDKMRSGSFEFCDSVTDKLNIIGPDLLKEDISLEQYSKVIKKKEMLVSEFLMEQKYFSGIGNYLRAEIMYMANIYHNKITTDLTEEEIERLHKYSILIIKEAYQMGGMTLATYINPRGESGKYVARIYGRITTDKGEQVYKSKIKDRTFHHII